MDRLSSAVLDKKGALEGELDAAQARLAALAQETEFQARCSNLERLLQGELNTIDARNERAISEQSLRRVLGLQLHCRMLMAAISCSIE